MSDASMNGGTSQIYAAEYGDKANKKTALHCSLNGDDNLSVAYYHHLQPKKEYINA